MLGLIIIFIALCLIPNDLDLGRCTNDNYNCLYDSRYMYMYANNRFV